MTDTQLDNNRWSEVKRRPSRALARRRTRGTWASTLSKRLGPYAIASVLACTGCQSYDPVPVSSCDDVVGHAKKLLGNQADSWSKMSAQCEAATDQERGCVLVADSAADVLRCAM